MDRFFRYELRTTDVEAGRAFYSAVLGAGFWEMDVSVVPLPERIRALGAPSNWLGYVGVADVEGTVGRMVGLGGLQLGPVSRGGGGEAQAVLRDPFGAVLAVSGAAAAAAGERTTAVVWHLLNAQDEARGFALYAELFGWVAGEAVDLGAERGRHQLFAWDGAGRSAGSVANTARPPRIHPQWLYFFGVPDIAAGVEKVRAGGGLALETLRTSTGDLAVACDDPQGAAFGLYQVVQGGR
jgi:uncharacterized protein